MITQIEPLKESEKRYRFYRDGDGQAWKVLLTRQTSRSALVVTDTDLATVEYAITLSVSPVDDAGDALLDGELPIVMDSHTHTFTSVEQSARDYDPDARILGIVLDLIETGGKVLAGNRKIAALVDGWAD